MPKRPNPEWVRCPECGADAVAVIPEGEVVEDEVDADGKVWANCHECGAGFLVYYRREA